MERFSEELTASQGILEDLLKAEELEAVVELASVLFPFSLLLSHGLEENVHRQVHGGMETETTLVRAKSRVKLHAVAAVHLQVAIVILPDDAELDDALGDGADLEGGAVLGVLLEEGALLKGAGELCRRSGVLDNGKGLHEKIGTSLTYPCRPARTRAQRASGPW